MKNGLLDKFQELATAGDAPGPTPEQFESLRPVYEDQISSVVFGILDEYNSNRSALSAPVRVTLPETTLDQLNAGGTAVLNLYGEQLFLPDQENLRIVDLQVIDLQVEYIGEKNDVFYSDIIFQHSGFSSLQKQGELYLFRHYSDETRSKIGWSSRFDPFERSFDRTYEIGSTAVLEAPEGIGQYVFEGWQGTGVTDPESPVTTVVLNNNTQVQTIYRAVVPYVVQVIGGTGSGTYINGDTIEISAAIPGGYRFVRWEGA